jgi:ATP-dependent Clp protease protease subunit
MEEILARHTGQPIERIHRDTERDFYMSPDEAREYGMIDAVCTARSTRAAPSPNGGPA